MVKTKQKGIAKWLCLAVFALCISLCLAMATTNTAYAATTPKYTLAYDYTHYYNYNTSKSADGSGTGVLSASVKGDNGSMTTVKFYIYGSSTSGTANLSKGGAIASNSLTITLDASIQGYSMSVTNSSGTTVGSQSGKNYTLSNLSDGTYNFTCSLRGAGWNPNARAYAWYSMDVSSSFVVDTTAPTINGASTSSTGKYTNASTYISVSDSGSGAEALYMKAPGSSYYSNVGTSTTVSSTATNGLYYFYAKDKAGNTSSTYYLYLDTSKPTGTIKNSSGTAISGYTNGAFSYTATDTGSGVSYLQYKKPGSSSWLSYTSGTTIASTATNGQYQFRAVDKAGNVSDTQTIYLDSAAPTGTIKNSSGTAISGYTGGAFSYTATDTGSGVSYLQYKTPGSSSWTTYSSGTTISASATNGLYQFRAVDNAGNTSAVSSIYLDTAVPTGKITDSNGTTVTTTTNKAFKYTASDGLSGIAYMQYKKPNSTVWETYAAGTLIQTTDTNGIYRFRAFDNAGNESETVMICLDTVKPTGTLYGGTSTVASGGKTNANYVKFVPSDSMSGIKGIYVQTPSSSGYESYTSGSQLAEEGTYSFYCTDAAGNFSMIYTVILDKSAPILGCLQTEFYSTYGLGFTVSASDDSGSVKLYYKTPSSSSYVLAGTSSYSTTLESENGKYYFYAVDDLGNRSQTYWIDLQIVYPDPTIEHSGTDNSVCITWTNGNTATLNGDDYTKGTWIKTEGSYTVTVTNEYGLSTTKTFSITHNYVIVQIVEPTCTTKGYSVFKCTSCGDEYEGNVKLAFGHNYDVETIEATCTTYGCIKHTCLNCGDTYETDVRTALGHKYTETTKEATCTEDGGQLHTCTVCGYEYLTDTVKATGHDYTTRVVREPHCETAGERIFHCEKCGDEYYTEIPATGHNFELTESSVVDGENIRTYVCTNCGAVTTQNMGEQYEKVSSYVEYLFEQYQPYMWWVLLATAGVWSVVMGVFFGIAAKNEDKEKARKMIKNYVIGLVVIAVILVACPYLVRGIAALIAG